MIFASDFDSSLLSDQTEIDSPIHLEFSDENFASIIHTCATCSCTNCF